MLDWEPGWGNRSSGQPKKRWRSDIDKVSAKILGKATPGEWRIAADSREDWKAMEAEWLEELNTRTER